jgi:hypothetical protein
MRPLPKLGSGALVLVALVVLTHPAQASAGSTEGLGTARGLDYVRTKLLGVTGQAGPSATCPSDKTVTGGGGSIGGSAHNAALNATFPLVEGAGWTTEGRTGGASPRTVTTFGICSAGAVTTNPGPQGVVGADFFQSSVVYCGGSEARNSGGGVQAEGGDVGILSMRPYWAVPGFDPYWANGILNRGPGDATVTHFAICTTGLELRRRSSSGELRARRTGRAIARCKPGEAVAGGGLQAIRNGLLASDAWAVATRPWDSKQDSNATPEDGWLVRAHNAGPRLELVAYAICKR